MQLTSIINKPKR